jgi:[acyl-carrier-protein] S-malonyltransferase
MTSIARFRRQEPLAMNCFMFPGQPFSNISAPPEDAGWSHIADLVRKTVHFDLGSFRWLEGVGSEHVGFQLQGVAQSLYHLRLLRGHGVWPGLVAQHSMGIYPALVACGCLPEAQAVEITWRVGACLAQLGRYQQYALGCVIGLPLEPLQGVADNNQVYVANHNTSHHYLLSGRKEEVDQALAEALECGAFSARSFACEAPLHTPLIAQLEGELEEIFAGYSFTEPALPLMNHLNQDYLGAADIPWFLLRELQLPVYWERTYRALRDTGVTRFFEVGSGETLQKLNRWIDGDIGTPICR